MDMAVGFKRELVWHNNFCKKILTDFKLRKMEISNHPILTESNAREVVLSCIRALNQEDYKTARKYMAEDMVFEGVLGSRNGAEAYFRDMEKMRFKYAIIKVFSTDDDVCLLYNLNMAGKKIFCCGWYHVEDSKIDSLKVIFDPRPVLEASENKKPS